MTTGKELVDAINSGKSAAIESAFESLMAEKVTAAIENRRLELVDEIFNSSEDVSLDTEQE